MRRHIAKKENVQSFKIIFVLFQNSFNRQLTHIIAMWWIRFLVVLSFRGLPNAPRALKNARLGNFTCTLLLFLLII